MESKNSKQESINHIFSNISGKYDLMNDLMTFGLQRTWKQIMINNIVPRKNFHLLDMAFGTGDISFSFFERNKKILHNSKLTLCDINIDMLRMARRRKFDDNIFDWICANAENIPIETDLVDAYTISFGLRNVTNVDAALQEAYRVIKPGGKFLCLEFGKVDSELLGKLYSIYSKKFIPTLGKLVTGNRGAYEYLINSINEFPHQTTLFKKIKKCGFKKGNFINLFSGIVVLYYAWKI